MQNNSEQKYDHPAFPQPTDRDATVWRYMNVGKFGWLVTHKRLFMPSADRLRDPFEGKAPRAELEWWESEAVKAADDKQRAVIRHNREFLSKMAAAFRPHYYVSCWHMNQHESYAMWNCYTAGPEALAISTTYSALKECLPSYVEIGVVRYIDYVTERLPSMNMFEYIMHKRLHYSFEKEVRAVAFPPATDELGGDHFKDNIYKLDSEPEFRVYAPQIDLSMVIREVVMHPDAPEEFQAQMIDLCSVNQLPTPRQSKKRGEPII